MTNVYVQFGNCCPASYCCVVRVMGGGTKQREDTELTSFSLTASDVPEGCKLAQLSCLLILFRSTLSLTALFSAV